MRGADGVSRPPLERMALRSYVGGVVKNTPENLVRWIPDPPSIDPILLAFAAGAAGTQERRANLPARTPPPPRTSATSWLSFLGSVCRSAEIDAIRSRVVLGRVLGERFIERERCRANHRKRIRKRERARAVGSQCFGGR